MLPVQEEQEQEQALVQVGRKTRCRVWALKARSAREWQRRLGRWLL